jgi:hypothetical protein
MGNRTGSWLGEGNTPPVDGPVKRSRPGCMEGGSHDQTDMGRRRRGGRVGGLVRRDGVRAGGRLGIRQARPHDRGELDRHRQGAAGRGGRGPRSPLGVCGQHRSVRPKREDMQAVLDALKTAGIAAKDMQTTNVSLQQRVANRGKPNEQHVFVASNAVQVTIHDLSSVGSVIDAVVEAGADSVNDIRFQLANPNTIRSHALSQAVAGAHTKADALARAAGAQVVRVVTISEQNYRAPVYRAQGFAEAAPSAGIRPWCHRARCR